MSRYPAITFTNDFKVKSMKHANTLKENIMAECCNINTVNNDIYVSFVTSTPLRHIDNIGTEYEFDYDEIIAEIQNAIDDNSYCTIYDIDYEFIVTSSIYAINKYSYESKTLEQVTSELLQEVLKYKESKCYE